ncbi:hypothetical protein [Saccharicrinis sp. FJH54]|uniref:hypothetical protein n=1 Tax=Saccharicrinis sp. FJH54 TaxID=3344665 RepID=UPI0035D45753
MNPKQDITTNREIDTEQYPLQEADPQIIPKPTIWPITTAFGVMFLLWALIASLGLLIPGILITGIGVAGWISDLKPEEDERD